MTSPRIPNAAGVLTAMLVMCTAALTVVALGDDGHGGIDRTLTEWAIAHRNGVLTPIAVTVSVLSGTIAMTVLATLTCMGLSWQRRWPAAALVAGAGLGAGLLVRGGKNLVGRARPPVEDHLISVANLSYPSGHSVGSFVVIGVVAVVALPSVRGPSLRILAATAAVVFVAAVGLSRIYLGVHWATDILGGWCIGALWLILCLTVYRYFEPVQEAVGASGEQERHESPPGSGAAVAGGDPHTRTSMRHDRPTIPASLFHETRTIRPPTSAEPRERSGRASWSPET
ncbi:phosphatase PAP2 family protein [Nocardia sp. NBC_00508]|uniref:phosphatase PAP2 family protein n=1 Tax=Nocardia sp. NBC_00508 TaxID=2975992 RepID=UPI002E801C50|nr:phosphatase PAP2 family protein [Nocardia sp. NBC_00508]WUD69190.1 phosphatase PAP2 family protein [Nocardia sp. NBC_00508]